MKIDEARKIVAEYQKWRMDAPPYDNIIGDFEYEEKVNEAIDTLLAATTVTDEMVERMAAFNHQESSGDFYYPSRSHLKAALQAALGGGE